MTRSYLGKQVLRLALIMSLATVLETSRIVENDALPSCNTSSEDVASDCGTMIQCKRTQFLNNFSNGRIIVINVSLMSSKNSKTSEIKM